MKEGHALGKSKPYQVNKEKEQAMRNSVEDMMKKGMIQESRSPYSSPVIMVPKPELKQSHPGV